MEFARETALLASQEAKQFLQAALTGDPEVNLPGFTARLDDLHYRPGSEVTALYTVTFEADGSTVTQHLLATTAALTGQVASVTRDDLTLWVWRHPLDPRLPGLAPACDPDSVLGWLRTPGRPAPARFELDLLAYRPLRRAVLRARLDDDEFFIKVLRPGYDDRLAVRHALFAEAGRSVPVVSRPSEGVLVLERAPGVPLAEALAVGPVEPASLLHLLDGLPPGLLDLPRRPSWSDRLDFHAATAAQRLPAASERLTTLAAEITRILALGRHGPEVPTHGDCYETNIFVAGQRWLFIDVDNAGPGLREDDLACALAHLAVLPLLDPAGWAGIPATLATWSAAFRRVVDGPDLLARTAAVLVSLIASVPVEQGEPVLALAETYAGQARGLLAGSGPRDRR